MFSVVKSSLETFKIKTLFSGIIIFCVISLASLSSWSKETQVEVKLKLSPTGHFDAKTDRMEGVVVVTGGKVSAQSVRVPLATLVTGLKLRDEHMKNKYLEVEKYPHAILHFGEGQSGQGQGEIEIRGIKKSIEGHYELKGDTLSAEFKLKLSDFNFPSMKYMGISVKDEVLVKVQTPVTRK
jgi:polyisoprenoid-binding protein YceI